MVVPPETHVIRAWKPPIAGVREVFHATFTTHAYPPHVHDVWTVFIVDDGAIRYDLDGVDHAAGHTRVTVLPPHVVHDGRAATTTGFRKRVLYLETSVLGEELIGPAVDRPVVPDTRLRDAVADLHDALLCPDDLLEAESRLAFVAARIRASLGEPPTELPIQSGPDLAERLRAHLDAHLFEPVTIGDAASEIGAPLTQVARAFASVFGISPHAYVVGRRLESARDRILAGQPLADVAAEVGFHDQAHLSRRFMQFLGTTPGRFRGAGRAG
jgi:AraC-like DNA-binding protein